MTTNNDSSTKIAIVTGGSRGIGRCYSRIFQTSAGAPLTPMNFTCWRQAYPSGGQNGAA
jgi:NADP-dependent 3-hydroxy acid dehydrogenase YdfG